MCNIIYIQNDKKHRDDLEKARVTRRQNNYLKKLNQAGGVIDMARGIDRTTGKEKDVWYFLAQIDDEYTMLLGFLAPFFSRFSDDPVTHGEFLLANI